MEGEEKGSGGGEVEEGVRDVMKGARAGDD
jgi:hypothetical protein